MKITYSAPVCVPLSGEEAALYGKPVLLVASDFTVTCTISEAKTRKKDELVEVVELAVLRYLKIDKKRAFTWAVASKLPTTDITYKTTLIVVLVAGLLEFYTGKEYPVETVNTLSFQIEKKYFHFSLGFFTSCSCFGGVQYFRKEFEFLKSISKLNFKIPKNIEKNLYINFSGKVISPEKSIQTIQKRYNRDPAGTEIEFSRLEKLTKRLVVAIAQENESLFKKTFLEVVSKKVGLGSSMILSYSSTKNRNSAMHALHISYEGLLRQG